jgi:hypothetical protein
VATKQTHKIQINMKNAGQQDTARSQVTPAVTNETTQSNQSGPGAIPPHVERLRAAFRVDLNSGSTAEQLNRLFGVQGELGVRLRHDGDDANTGMCNQYLLAHYRRMQRIPIAPPIATDAMLFVYEQWVQAELQSTSPGRSPLFDYAYRGCGGIPSEYKRFLRCAQTHHSVIKFFAACACLSEMRSFSGPGFEVPGLVESTVDSEWIVEFAPLREMLLGLGGKFFPPVGGLFQAFPPILLRQISALGRSFPGSDANFVTGHEGICQADPYELAQRPDLEVWTGFALGIDMWEPHSWLVRNGVILDVARRRTWYFGFRLNLALKRFAPVLFHSHTGNPGCIANHN